MDISIIQEYIATDALILIPVLWVLGYFLKQSPNIPNWVIVWVILVCGIIGGFVVVSQDADGIIQGILVAGVTVLGYELLKQAKIGQK